ncbi:MAG TPA: vWA domain-containing protein [Gaiellaceae bacterium]|nr:vWA domain-containing protein [Gaiellaceae bacterium]
MRRLRPEPDAIPASEPGRLQRFGRRTTYLRAALGAGLVVLLAAAVLVARQYDVRNAPLVASGSSGVVVLDLSASVFEGGFEATVRKLVETDERAGLVVFSDAAYELLPPGSSGREFQPLLRFFRSTATGFLPPNPWDRFRAGTRISEGLKVAREALLREGGPGKIILLSDLEVLPDEVQRLVLVFSELRRDGFDVEIIPLGAREEQRRLLELFVGADAFLPEPVSGAEAVQARGEGRITTGIPWWFVLVGLVLVAALAVNERMLTRLEVRT